MARELDDPSRQSSAREFRRAESRRAPGFLGLARRHHDGAVFPRAQAGGSRRGKTAREPGVPRDPISARRPDPREARSIPRLRRRPELSLAHQGHRRRRFLDRLGGPRRGANAVRLAGAGLRARPRLGPRAARGPHDRAGRRRRARRRQRVRSPARRLEAGPAELLVDHRLQPAEPRRGGARGPVGALRGAVPRIRMGRGHPQIRLSHAPGVRRARRRAAARVDRSLPELAVFRAGVPGRRRLA